MNYALWFLLCLAAVLAVVAVVWRFVSRRHTAPCPTWLRWLVEIDNPLARTTRAAVIVEHLGLEPGMAVLDLGCGPGRVTIPVAERVGPSGTVVPVDIQAGMLSRVVERAQAAGVTNIQLVQAAAGDGRLGRSRFDRALLVTVLGEIPDREAALKEVFEALKPGGVLSVSETVFDPHYQRRATVTRLAEEVGFRTRGAFGNWTLLFAISAFSLSLLGTFLVRSGVLTSVHAFASDPTRGIFILAYLAVVVGGSLTLYAIRAPKMIQGGGFAGISRETLLLINNLVLTVMTAMVLIGTLYPLLIDALGAGKISVGPPYFGLLFSMLLVPLVLTLPVGIYIRWQQDGVNRLVRNLVWPFLLTVVSGVAIWFMYPEIGLVAAAGVTGGIWVILGSLFYFWKITTKKSKFRLPGSVVAMTLAHIGLGVFLIGASLTGSISSEKHLRMEPGDVYVMAGYSFQFNGTRVVRGPNYMADEGEFVVTREGREITRLYPQKRQYTQGGQTMTEAAIDPGLTRDVYVSLGEPLDDTGHAWAVRLYHKPFVRWIWLGSIFMMFGGIIAAANKRYRRKIKAEQPQQAGTREATA
jgi:SAM-dependent methyltransferase